MVRGIARLGEAVPIRFRRLGECPTLDRRLKIIESFVQIRVQKLAMVPNHKLGGVPDGWCLDRLNFTRGPIASSIAFGKAESDAQARWLSKVRHDVLDFCIACTE